MAAVVPRDGPLALPTSPPRAGSILAVPTYADKAACEEYTEGLVVTDDAQFDRVIERAERNVDTLLTTPGDPDVAGPKLAAADLAAMSARDRERLERATCAQVEYRVEMGEEFFARHQYKGTSGPDFSVQGQLPLIGPKVEEELAGFLYARLGTDWTGVPWT